MAGESSASEFSLHATHASWVNLVECFFSILTRTGLQQQVHKSGRALERFLKDFIKTYNENCGPFTWSKGPKKLSRIIQLTKLAQESGIA